MSGYGGNIVHSGNNNPNKDLTAELTDFRNRFVPHIAIAAQSGMEALQQGRAIAPLEAASMHTMAQLAGMPYDIVAGGITVPGKLLEYNMAMGILRSTAGPQADVALRQKGSLFSGSADRITEALTLTQPSLSQQRISRAVNNAINEPDDFIIDLQENAAAGTWAGTPPFHCAEPLSKYDLNKAHSPLLPSDLLLQQRGKLFENGAIHLFTSDSHASLLKTYGPEELGQVNLFRFDPDSLLGPGNTFTNQNQSIFFPVMEAMQTLSRFLSRVDRRGSAIFTIGSGVPEAGFGVEILSRLLIMKILGKVLKQGGIKVQEIENPVLNLIRKIYPVTNIPSDKAEADATLIATSYSTLMLTIPGSEQLHRVSSEQLQNERVIGAEVVGFFQHFAEHAGKYDRAFHFANPA